MSASNAFDRISRSLEFGAETDGNAYNRWQWYLIILPKLLAFGLIMVVPFVAAVWISLHHWEPLATTHPFIGLKNYEHILGDPVFWLSLRNTLAYSVGLIVFDVPIALGLALLLNKNLRGTKFYSGAIFLPVVTSWVVVSLIWSWLYNPQYGLINAALGAVGLSGLPWLQSSSTALAAIVIMSIWKNAGFNMVIFLAGLRAIPGHFYEAARMDGAGRIARFRYITLPLLKPTSFFVVTVTMIESFRLFTQVYVMTNGGPAQSTYSIVFYFWQQGFQQFNMGYASALAVVLFVIVFVLSLAQQFTWGDHVQY